MYGELIRAARKKKGWTQSDLAYKLGINPVGIVQWEQNRRNPKFETRQKIARALDIDITELMLLSEKEDYEKKHGDCESRINFAVYEIERLLDEKTEQIESCGGTVTPEHEKKWVLENLDCFAEKYNVSKGAVKEALNHDLALWPSIPDEKSPVPKKVPPTHNPAKELTLILEGLNESGRAAVLHHARELSKIPDYQKKEH